MTARPQIRDIQRRVAKRESPYEYREGEEMSDF